MPIFKNTSTAPQNSKPGDYILRVIALEKGLSKGAKTCGCTCYDLTLLVESTGSKLGDMHVFADNEFFQAKSDTFLKSCGVEIKPGESWDFDEDDAKAAAAETGKPCRYINPIGLRGWATIKMKAPKEAGGESKWNEVAVWLTNKEKLPRHVEPQAEPDWN